MYCQLVNYCLRWNKHSNCDFPFWQF